MSVASEVYVSPVVVVVVVVVAVVAVVVAVVAVVGYERSYSEISAEHPLLTLARSSALATSLLDSDRLA